jgi:hypothetical protein
MTDLMDIDAEKIQRDAVEWRQAIDSMRLSLEIALSEIAKAKEELNKMRLYE